MSKLSTIPAWAKITAIVVVILLLFVGCGVSTSIGVTNEVNKLENRLSAEYSDTLQSLSNCTQKTRQSIQVAGVGGDKIAGAVQEIVAARNPVGADAAKTAFVSALNEAGYDGTAEQVADLYRTALTVANGCQDDFTTSQKLLREDVRVYEDKINGSVPFRIFGSEYPSEHLEAAISDDNIITGKPALRKMKALIKTGSTEQAATTGTVPEADLFPTTTVG